MDHDDDQAWNEALGTNNAKTVSLCWEGYCPCDPPQGGPDQLLCDQLRGGNIDPEMLSIGKSMRKVREQTANYDF